MRFDHRPPESGTTDVLKGVAFWVRIFGFVWLVSREKISLDPAHRFGYADHTYLASHDAAALGFLGAPKGAPP